MKYSKKEKFLFKGKTLKKEKEVRGNWKHTTRARKQYLYALYDLGIWSGYMVDTRASRKLPKKQDTPFLSDEGLEGLEQEMELAYEGGLT